MRTNYYVDGAEWCVLINEYMPDWLIEDFIEREDIRFLFCPFHIEPIQRFNNNPPGNEHWCLFKRNLTENQAYEWLTSEEAKSTIVRILQDHNIDINDIGKRSSNGLSNRYDILERDGFKCCICGRSANDGVKLEVDHKHPKSKGGKNNHNNLWTLCFDCNRGKRDKLIKVEIYDPH